MFLAMLQSSPRPFLGNIPPIFLFCVCTGMSSLMLPTPLLRSWGRLIYFQLPARSRMHFDSCGLARHHVSVISEPRFTVRLGALSAAKVGVAVELLAACLGPQVSFIRRTFINQTESGPGWLGASPLCLLASPIRDPWPLLCHSLL